MTMINEEEFGVRLKKADKLTRRCLDVLVKNLVISSIRTASKKQDINGIDYWLNGDAVQFKTRCNGRGDIPAVLAQPMWGWDSPDTVVGRDLRCLLQDCCKYHYVGLIGEDNFPHQIFRINSQDIKNVAGEIIHGWKEVETFTQNGVYNFNWFTSSMIQKWVVNRDKLCVYRQNDCQIWWKKNDTERFGKFNLYLPLTLFPQAEVLYSR